MDTYSYSWASPITLGFQRWYSSFNHTMIAPSAMDFHFKSFSQGICLLIESNSRATLLMSFLSIGDSDEHASPIWKTNIKHSVCPLVQSLQLETMLSSSPTLLKIEWSTISITRPGNANLTKLWRFRSSLNSLSVGLLLVNISNKRIPKLYTSPLVESWLPIPYSAKI